MDKLFYGGYSTDTDKSCTQVGLHLTIDKNVCIVYDNDQS